MLRYLILGLSAACALSICAASQAGRPASVQLPQPHGPAIPPKPATAEPRHLSDAERAELRRQLEDFNRRYGKRS